MSSTALKILALIFMTIDHIGRFVPGVPFFTRIIGRAAAPLFLFCSRWGYRHTSDRLAYLKRLYLFSVLVGIMNYFLNSLYPNAYHPVTGNIFSSIFLIFYYIYRYDTGEKEKEKFALMHILSLLLHHWLPAFTGLEIRHIINALVPSVFVREGTFLVFIMGQVLYNTVESKEKLTKGYLCFCGIYFALTLLSNTALTTRTPLPVLQYIFQKDIQWLQVSALPFMLMYNGKKGKGLKYLFYLYYPLHTAVLFIIGNIM